ncbi:hypothetical protein ACSBR1_003484 [Camellia fascicularis]
MTTSDLHTGKHRLKDFHMTTFDVKNRMIQFPSRYAYDAAIRAINWKACLYKLERVDRSQWDFITPHGGKSYLQRALAKLKDHNTYQAGAASPVNADSQLEEIQQEIHRSRSQLEEMEKRLKYLALPEKPNNIHLFESSKIELAIMNYM